MSKPDGWVFYYGDKTNTPFIVWNRKAAKQLMRELKDVTVRPFVFTDEKSATQRPPLTEDEIRNSNTLEARLAASDAMRARD